MDSSRRRYHKLLPAPTTSSTPPTSPSARGVSSSDRSSRPMLPPPTSSGSSRAQQTREISSPTSPSQPTRSEGVSDFIKRLSQILQNSAYHDIVAWGPRGDTFVVKNITEFSNTVLPQVYKHKNFSSFVRQLNKYDFHKIKTADSTEDSATYRHPDFRSDQLGALDTIRRKATVPRKSYASVVTGASLSHPHASQTQSPISNSPPSPSPSTERGDPILRTQLDQIMRAQDSMSSQIRSLEKNYHDVLVELVGIQRTMAQQDVLTQTLIRQFLQPELGLPLPTLPSLQTQTQTMSIGDHGSQSQSHGQHLDTSWMGNWDAQMQMAPSSGVGGAGSGFFSSSSSSLGGDTERQGDLRRRIEELQRIREELRLRHQQRAFFVDQGEGEGEDTEMVMPSVVAPAQVPSHPGQPQWAVPPRVLVVDDDEATQRLVGRLLERIGCTYDVAPDGMVAVARVNANVYDLVLMDIIMPKLDGLAAVKLIRRTNSSTPIVSMTSNVQPSDIMAYYSSGMTDVLGKPFNKNALQAVLEKHIPPSFVHGSSSPGHVFGDNSDELQIRPAAGMTDEQYNDLVQSIIRREVPGT